MIRIAGLAITIVTVAYLLVTWFYFGSAHPCGIYETVRRWQFDAMVKANIERVAKERGGLAEAFRALQADEDKQLAAVKKGIQQMTPFECSRWAVLYWRKEE
jgi:hypothetical protein